MIRIIPAILTSDLNELKDMLLQCEGVRSTGSELIDRVQIDIIDGIFADNKTIDPLVLKDIDTDLNIDFQLMVKEPIEWIEKCIRGKAQRIIGHLEMMKSQKEFVDEVIKAGLEVGLGLDLDTSVNELDGRVLRKLDAILLMSVPAGFGGQEFRKEVIEKIDELSNLRKKDGYKYKICVDGGITLGNIKCVAEAGADEVAIGRRLFKGDLTGNIDRYLKAVYRLNSKHEAQNSKQMLNLKL